MSCVDDNLCIFLNLHRLQECQEKIAAALELNSVNLREQAPELCEYFFENFRVDFNVHMNAIFEQSEKPRPDFESITKEGLRRHCSSFYS